MLGALALLVGCCVVVPAGSALADSPQASAFGPLSEARAVELTEDTSPPVLAGLSFSPDTVDVTAAEQAVTVTAHITDNLSGFAEGGLSFESPSGKQYTVFGSFTLVSGTDTDGVYQARIPFYRYVQSGTWRVLNLSLLDNARNLVFYHPAQLEAAGLPATVQVQSAVEDVSPPVLRALSFSPDTVDVTAAEQAVTITAHVTDNLSGFAEGGLSFGAPSGRRYTGFGFFKLVSGTDTDGMYQASIAFPRYLQAGAWKVTDVSLRDAVRNYAVYYPAQLEAEGLPTTVQVQSAGEDTAPSVLAGLSFSPDAVNVASSSQTVTVTAHITDNLSGFASGGLSFESPTSRRFVYTEYGSFKLVSGTDLDGVYQATVPLPRYLQEGAWKVNDVVLQDNVRNFAAYSAAQLEAAGLPSSVQVTNAVPPPPPTIKRVRPRRGPTAGGTRVIVTGANFLGATAVEFGASEAASFTVNSPTSITAISPPEAAGEVRLTVTTPQGTSVATRATRFKFVARR